MKMTKHTKTQGAKKEGLRQKFIAASDCITKMILIYNLYFKELEKEKQTKSKTRRRKDIIKIRVETNGNRE
jgi:hypothetical protein